MKIELLYFDDCPGWRVALDNLTQVLGDEAEIDMRAVETDAQAQSAQFVGSPTLRINGRDLFPANHNDYALSCRIYQTPDGPSDAPTVSMIRDALNALDYPGALPPRSSSTREGSVG